MPWFDVGKFKDGASYLLSDWAYQNYVRGKPLLGRDTMYGGELFVAPPKEVDKAIQEANGDLTKLEQALGLSVGSLGKRKGNALTIHRVDIPNPNQHNLRGANGLEWGANCFFNTPRDEKGNLPNIVFYRDDKEKICKDAFGRDIIDAGKTDKGEIKKLKGRYATNTGDLSYTMIRKRGDSGALENVMVYVPNGDIHEAEIANYSYTTSGGVPEGILTRVPNTPDHVLRHVEITGWKRGRQSDDVRRFGDMEAYRLQKKYVVQYHSLDGKPIQQGQTQPVNSNSETETNKFGL